jgi:general secretion pathway protein M
MTINPPGWLQMKTILNLKTLKRRDRYIIFAAAGLLLVLLLLQLVIVPFFGKGDRLQQQIQAKTRILAEMQRMQSEYRSIQNTAQFSKARYTERQKGFSLFSFLDRLAGEAGIKDRISYMKPSNTVQKDGDYRISRVEMKLDDITLEQLSTYLFRVETSDNLINIKKMSISKKDRKQGLINVILQVETIEI